MRTTYSKSGSSLLVVLLLLSAVGSMVLATSRLVINNNRLATSYDSGVLADQMVKNGLEEGLIVFNNFSPINPQQEHPAPTSNASTPYALSPLRRGYAKPSSTAAKACTTFPSTTTNFDLTCPYYELAVRRMVALTAAENGAFAYTAKELPVQANMVIPISNFTPFTLSASTGFVGVVTIQTCRTLNGSNCNSTVQTLRDGNPLLVFNATNPATRSLLVTVQTALDPVQDKVRIEGIQGVGNTLVIGKGSTTIDVAGFAGGVRRKQILTITPNGSKNVKDFTQTFNTSGLLVSN